MLDKQVFNEWRATTNWGALFNRYASGPQAIPPVRAVASAVPAAQA